MGREVERVDTEFPCSVLLLDAMNLRVEGALASGRSTEAERKDDSVGLA